MELKDVKPPQLYSLKEVALQMHVSTQTVYRLVKSGRLKAIDVSHKGKKPILRFRAEDVQAYYDSISNSSPWPKSVDE